MRAKEAELMQQYRELRERFGLPPDPERGEVILWQDAGEDVAREEGVDPALMEALQLVHDYGLRGARKHASRNRAWMEHARMTDARDMDRNHRVQAYVDEWCAGLGWRSRVGRS
jgi:hypothetical protein